METTWGGRGTRIAFVVLVVIVVVVAATAYFSYTNPGVPPIINSSSASSASANAILTTASSSSQSSSRSTCAPSPGPTGNSSYTVTQTVGEWPSCDCTLVESNSNGTLYVSTNAVVGDEVCIAASMTESPTVSFKVMGPAGVILSMPGCVNSAFSPVSCEASWDTAQPGYPQGNPVQPGVYELLATGESQSLEANFTLGPSGVSTSAGSAPVTCQTQSSSASTRSSGGVFGVSSAVTPNVYFNGSAYTGPAVNFIVLPGSHASVLVNVSYPWQNVQPPPAQGFCVEFSFAIGPFPANSNASTIPDWMHVSLSAPSVEIPYKSSATVSLLASVDDSAPQDSGASFELLIHYLDPASGNSVTGGYIISIQT